MFAPKFCCNQQIRFLQRFRRVLFILLLSIVSIAFNVETFADNAYSQSAPAESQTRAIAANDNPADVSEDAAVSRSESPSEKDAKAANNSDKNSTAANDAADEEESVDALEMLNVIRKSYAQKLGIDNLNDDLILSQSSAYIFLSQKKIRDVANNILDYWYLSFFEDDFNLTLIAFNAVVINPLVIDLDSDIGFRLSLKNFDNSLVNCSETAGTFNAFINFPIPESVMEYIKENSEEIVDVTTTVLLPETFSSYNYVVLFLAILGFSILGYVIYRIVVWAFMLDQNPDYDIQNGRDDDVVAPVNMDVYNDYFYQLTPKDKR